MPDVDIYKTIIQIVHTDNINDLTSNRSLIKFLLPIDSAFGYYTGNKAEFYDPQEDQIFYRNFKVEDEESRLNSINYINGRIDYYNRHCDEQIKKGVLSRNEFSKIPHVYHWAVKLRLVNPIVQSTSDFMLRNNIALIRIVDDEYIYKCARHLSTDVFIPRFNKMIYDYLISLTKGKTLVVQNTFYNPILEFEDWFMSSGLDIDKTPSLLKGLKGVKKSISPVILDVDTKTTSINLKPTVKANPDYKKWYQSPIEAKIVNLIENDSLDSFVDDCRFKNVNKINIKKLSEKLNCSDKTAKKMLQLHAPYILEL